MVATVAATSLAAAAVAHFVPWEPSGWGPPIAAAAIAATGAWFVVSRWRGSVQRFREAKVRAAGDDAQDRLRRHASEQEALTAAIVATATEGIITIDTKGAIETINGAAEKLFGYRADEVIGKNVKLLMGSPHHELHDGYLDRYLRTGEKRIIGIGREVDGLRKDGTSFPIDLSVGEGFTENRRFFTAIVRDITDRKEMQAKLAQAERLAAVGELAAGVAHEVNNPINTIINSAQLVLDGDEPKAHCEVVITEGQRIAEIVQDLLQFARDDRDRPQATSLPDVVVRTLRLIGENLKRHGIRMRTDVPDDLPQVLARPQQVQQVLLNLLINAKDALVEARGDGREVQLSASSAGDGGVELTVRDNGPGIPQNLRRRIFEPFVTTKRARGGTGLGLSISKSIVEGYGGRIDVTSEPGHGAEFRVWLPRCDSARD